MAKKVDVIKAFKKLPYEAQQQIETILDDDNLKLEDVSIQYIIKDVKWTIERLHMDLSEWWEDDPEYLQTMNDIKECKKWMRYYEKYDKYKGKDYFNTMDE